MAGVKGFIYDNLTNYEEDVKWDLTAVENPSGGRDGRGKRIFNPRHEIHAYCIASESRNRSGLGSVSICCHGSNPFDLGHSKQYPLDWISLRPSALNLNPFVFRPAVTEKAERLPARGFREIQA